MGTAESTGRQANGADRIDTWLREVAFPFWAEVGVDTRGPGFVEHLTLGGRPADVSFKRVRVQARQIYCFCQAAELGWRPDAVEIAQRGVDLLLRSAWQGIEQGWVSTLTASGEPLAEDSRPLRHRLRAFRPRLVAQGDGGSARDAARQPDARLPRCPYAASHGIGLPAPIARRGAAPAKPAHAFDGGHDRAARQHRSRPLRGGIRGARGALPRTLLRRRFVDPCRGVRRRLAPRPARRAHR